MSELEEWVIHNIGLLLSVANKQVTKIEKSLEVYKNYISNGFYGNEPNLLDRRLAESHLEEWNDLIQILTEKR